jgi:hypothetical protein
MSSLFPSVNESLDPNPFPLTAEEMENQQHPRIFGSFQRLSNCARRSFRSDAVTFWDGAGEACGLRFVQEMKVILLRDQTAAAWLENDLRKPVDPTSTVWPSKDTYEAYLRRHNRLVKKDEKQKAVLAEMGERKG